MAATQNSKTTSQKRKPRSGSQQSASKKNTYQKKRTLNTPKKENSPYYDELLLIFTLVISILLVLSIFNLGGKISDAVNHFTFGMMGGIAYVFPVFLFFMVAFAVSNRKNDIARRKMISFVLLLLVFMSLLHLFNYPDIHTSNLLNNYTLCAESKNGGGLFGALISKTLVTFFGIIGSYVILIALMIVLFVLITEKLVFSGLAKKSNRSYLDYKSRRKLKNKYNEEHVSKEYEDITDRSNSSDKKQKAKTFKFQANQEDISIQRSAQHPDNTVDVAEEIELSSQEDMNTVYEKELHDKFGQNDQVIGWNDDPKILPDVVDPDFEIFQESSGQFGLNKKHKKKPVKENVEELIQPVEELITDDSNSVIKKEYRFPPLNLLSKPKGVVKGVSDRELKETALKLQSTLESFGVRVTVTNVSCGPSVTRYELQPEQGVKVSKITNLADDIKLNLATADIRIEAPIPGKAAVGIEVPNKVNSAVLFRELIDSNEFKSHPSNLAFAVGRDIGGQTVVTDIAKMPHLLIAGATGSGKSVCINTLIMSILYKSNPSDVKLIMVDPKVVELSVYNGIPHLLIPVVTDPKKASAALNWAVMEMTDRYKKFAELGVRDMHGYNKKIEKVKESENENYQKLPQIVIIVDELADLMMVAPGEVEDAICRLAQMARAAGIHLIIATQRPSVNVITGLIKANVPSRIAFSVSSAIDSRTIIDGSGAEKLLGKGDMLFFPSGYPKPVRIQGAFISDKEVGAVVEYLSSQNSEHQYNDEIEGKIANSQQPETSSTSDRDEYFVEAGKFIIEKDKASIGMLQRVYKIGFNRAARIMDQLSDAGVVGPEEGTKPRKVLMSQEEFEQYIDEYV